MQVHVRGAARRYLARWSSLGVVVLLLQALAVPVPAQADQAGADGITDDLVLWYQLDEASGSVAVDSSGNGNDGTVVGTAAWAGEQGLTFDGSSTYVKAPNNIMSGLDSISVAFDVYIDSDQPTPYFLYGFGNTNSATGYGDGYLFTTGTNFRTAIATGDWNTEQNTRASSSDALDRGQWKHVAYTQTGNTGTLYEDGVAIATNTSVTTKPGDIGNGTTTANYVGKSNYSGDRLFKGKIRDFRVYDRALASDEVYELGGSTTAILGVDEDALKVTAMIDGTAGTVLLPVVAGTDVTRLSPAFTLPTGSTIAPASGSTQDFTDPVTYTVTDTAGVTQVWTVSAVEMRSPIIPGLYADPEVRYFDGKFYIYPTTDGYPGWSGTQFHAFSSTDLVNWTDEGVILDLGPDVSWADARAWAPSMVEHNGKYYFYFCAEAQLGVAVSDSPIGPFTDVLGKPLLTYDDYPGQEIDANVFIDTDGQPYLYWGNGYAFMVPLNDDMVSFDRSDVEEITPAGFREGSFVFKRGSTYYLSWSENDTGDENYQVAYATSSSPYGPWKKQAVILAKNTALGIRGPGHHSVVQVPGRDEWYIVYHRFAIPEGDGTHRETTIDRLEFNVDGTIRTVVPTLESIDPVDITAPTVAASVSPAAPASGWYTSAATVTVTATDETGTTLVPQVRTHLSGAAAGEWADSTGPLVLSTDGEHVVEFRATDSSGNTSTIGTRTVRVDATAPVSKAVVDPGARTVTLTAADSASGLQKIEYSLDGTTWSPYQSAITAGPAAATVSYRAVDVAGNVESTNTAELPKAGVPLVATTTTVTGCGTVAYGTPCTVKVLVKAGSGKPAGTVRVLDGSRLVGVGQLKAGTATITLDAGLTVGRHSLRVLYPGDEQFAASSATGTVTVAKVATRVTLSVTPTSVKKGQSAKAVVTVKAVNGVLVTGKVTIVAVYGSVKVTRVVTVGASGKATVSFGPLRKPGKYRVTAIYAGSTTAKSAVSSSVRVTVRK
jgi:GH43 family beta-xylosidase